MKKTTNRKLRLSKDTLRDLGADEVARAAGGLRGTDRCTVIATCSRNPTCQTYIEGCHTGCA